jgi:hypothetical protein
LVEVIVALAILSIGLSVLLGIDCGQPAADRQCGKDGGSEYPGAIAHG